MTIEDLLLTAGSTLLVLLSGVGLNLLGKEVESRLGALPVLMLRIARQRVPKDVRDNLYEEWCAELSEALHDAAERPITRLWLGVRFSFGLLRSASEVGRTLRVIRNRSADTATDGDGVSKPIPAGGDLPIMEGRILGSLRQVVFIAPTTYREARQIGQMFRSGNRVVVDLSRIDEDAARRLVDFSAGLCFAKQGNIERLWNRTFLLDHGNDEPECSTVSA